MSGRGFVQRAAAGFLAVCLGAPMPVAAAPVEVTVLGTDGRPLAGAVVWVDSAAARAAAQPVSGAEVVQRGKAFLPEVAVVTVGSAVDFPNQDTVRHHVYSFSPAKRFELKLYVGRPEKPVVFDKPGIAVLGCNIHDQMQAWVVVLESPWSARTNAQGRALMADVPSGTHVLRAWHPDFPVGAAALEQALVVGGSPLQTTLRVAG